MIDYTAWIDRINNALTIQRRLSLLYINLTLTRREAIELRQMVEALKDLDNIKIETDLQPGAEFQCGNVMEWHDLRKELELEGYVLEFMPGMVIKVIGKKEE